MTIKKKIIKRIEALIHIWSIPIEGEKELPIQFADNLVVGLFCGELVSIILYFYNLGRKAERKRRKKSMTKRYKKNCRRNI